jgi:hypothetical protein
MEGVQIPHRLLDVNRRPDPTRAAVVLQKLVETGFPNRGLAGVDQIDLVDRDIAADDRKPPLRECCRGNAADITQAKNTDTWKIHQSK